MSTGINYPESNTKEEAVWTTYVATQGSATLATIDNTDYGQVNEHLKTFYPFYKGLQILDEMASYYKYYYEIPRFFNQPLNEIIV